MKAQYWNCRGCGHVFFWVINVARKHRPACPNCKSQTTMASNGMFDIHAKPVSILGFKEEEK